MSGRIYTLCQYVDKQYHTSDDCKACPHPHFWDMAYRDLMEILTPGGY